MPLIETVDLTKHFERRRPPRRPWELLRRRPKNEAVDTVVAVDNVSLSVNAGEVYGLLGPNGAGKTTMARMLSTLLEPTSGCARICGHDTVDHGTEVRTRIGVMFAGERGLFWRLTGRENLQLFGRLVFMDRQAIRRRTDELMEQLGLADRTDELVESYSTGMKQRLNLARTLMHDPPVLLLDEPTAALDPAAARANRGFVDELRREGKAILLTTHNMFEADEVCDRVGIIDRGRLIAEDRPAELIKRAGVEPRLELMLRGDTTAARTAIGEAPLWWGEVESDGGVQVAVRAPDGWRSAEMITQRVTTAGAEIVQSRLREATLEDAYIELTGTRLEGPFDPV